MSWQNSGLGYGMPVRHPKVTDDNAKTIPKELRYTSDDFKTFRSPVGILKRTQLENNMNWARACEITGIKNKQGQFIFGAPAGWLESKSNSISHRGSSF